jgi:hypothetical protein
MSDRMGEIRGRLAAATPGPWAAEFDACSQCGGEWWVDGPPGGRHAQFAMKADAEVISNAPADLAWLIGEVERLTAALSAERVAAEMDREDTATVARIWIQLGSPTYEQLAGRSIYDLIDELKAQAATADAAGFARGVEAAAGVADEVSGRDDVPLLLRKSIWVAVRKDCASEIAAAIRALVTP